MFANQISRASTVQSLTVFCFLVIAGVFLSSCDYTKNMLKTDRAANLDIQDYRDGMASRLPEEGNGGDSSDTSSIPGLQPYVSSSEEAMESVPLVSLSVNQTVPLRDVLFELAKQGDYDLELDPNIRGAVIFTARNRPFDEVIERVCDLGGLRYKFRDKTLRVEVDRPYNKIYKVDYLSYIRSSSSSIRNNINVVSGDGADTGSEFEATSQSEADFWAELDLNLQQILGTVSSGAMKTMKDPKITATEQNPNVAAVAPPSASGEGGSVEVKPPDAVLKVESLPLDDEQSGKGKSSSSKNDDADTPSFAINKQAGLVSVFASEKAQKQVQEYLEMVRRSITSQVLIEAKVLEVTLNDEHLTGIDWRLLDLPGETTLNYMTSTGRAALAGLGTTSLAETTTSDTGGILDGAPNVLFGFNGDDAEALVKAVSGFGSVRALASPRLTMLNNQPAVLNVSTNRVFFELDVTVTTNDGGPATTDVDSTIRNVPEGVIINVLPSINLDDRTVTMAVRPTVTSVVGDGKPDPAVTYIAAAAEIDGVESIIPELNVQEIDSVIQVKSGQAVVMGGLLQDKNTSIESGVPGLSEVPMVGALFKQHQDRVKKTELIIFLKATILDNPSDNVHNTDKDIYRKFSQDRRPLKL